MQDPTQLYTRHDADAPVPAGLHLLVTLSGHLDAGHFGSQVRAALRDRLHHRTVASFDADLLHDYRARRPRIRFEKNRFTDLRMPRLDVELMEDLLGHPFLLLAGPEPDVQWERFVAAVLELVRAWDVADLTLVDAAPLPVPHTRRPGVTTYGTRSEAVEGLSTWSPEAEMLAGALQVLAVRAEQAGVGTAAFTVHVPHYVSEAAYPAAAVAGLEYAGAAMGLMLPTDELRDATREVEAELERQVAASEEIRTMIEGLEKNFDQNAEEQERSLLETAGGLPDGDQLASAVEAYLAERDSGTTPSGPAQGEDGPSPSTDGHH
ncbi:PAC2 family protein [Micrococcus sp.]|uniref:PAC2 family protein n=1 Tax=Micrococcus sp. TaxID=1271 RepID=UPI002A908642|nr:PAC2 family protein [Micrococcus sp.]MDY6055531.1 PAC2 family protein [Micrococcus sp.]